jgi:hypothetical protein
MDQLAHVLVFGTDDEFLNLLDQDAYNMDLGNAYSHGLLPFVGALLFQSDPCTENILFMTDLNNLIPFGTRPSAMGYIVNLTVCHNHIEITPRTNNRSLNLCLEQYTTNSLNETVLSEFHYK